jgi:uncharacterized membrane protein YkvA (DUF1232 family)
MKKEKLGKRGYKKYESKAKKYLNDNDKTSQLLSDARKKAGKKKGVLDAIWDKVQLLFNLLDDWVKGRYKVVPKKSIAMIIVAIVYFVFPIDLIPDFLLGLGFIDDVAVLGFVISQISKDIEKYRVWKLEKDIEPSKKKISLIKKNDGA